MNKSIKKHIIKTITIVVLLISVLGTSMLTFADDGEYIITNVGSNYASSYVHNVTSTGGGTSVGGLAVSSNNNRLFMLKARSSDDQVTVLRYYNNAYDTTGTPVMINFNDGILGHANGMSIDNSFLYVTMWKRVNTNTNSIVGNTYNNSIMVISRSAIAKVANYYSSHPNASTIEVNVADKIGPRYYIYLGSSKVFIGRVFVPIRSDNGQPYTYAIASIARYSYDEPAKSLKFIIGCRAEFQEEYNNYNGIAYKFMTFGYATENDKKMIVSENKNDTFFIDTSNVKYNGPNGVSTFTFSNSCHFQDIFFGKNQGLYIPVWDSTTPKKSYIFKVKLSQADATISNDFKVAKFYSFTVLDRSNDPNCERYEIESMAFLKRNQNMENDNIIRIVIGFNRAGTGDYVHDSYEILAGNNRANLVD